MPDATQGTGDVIAKLTGAINFENIIGMPLKAASAGSTANAENYIKFIKSCLDKDGKPILVPFERRETDIDGKETVRTIQVPLLAIIEHPNFPMTEFSDEFTLEISDTFEQTAGGQLEGSAEGKVGYGIFSLSAKASFSAHYNQTRKTDTRAKHVVSVKAEKAPPPEGMQKVLEWLTNDLNKQPNQKADVKQDS